LEKSGVLGNTPKIVWACAKNKKRGGGGIKNRDNSIPETEKQQKQNPGGTTMKVATSNVGERLFLKEEARRKKTNYKDGRRMAN